MDPSWRATFKRSRACVVLIRGRPCHNSAVIRRGLVTFQDEVVKCRGSEPGHQNVVKMRKWAIADAPKPWYPGCIKIICYIYIYVLYRF